VTVRRRMRCPKCREYHVDRPPWDRWEHRSHLCEFCGHVWRPFMYASVGVEPSRMTDDTRFACLASGLALIVIGWLSSGCVHTPTPQDPARCSVGASTAVSRGTGRQFGEPYYSEDVTITAWGECAL
jgi:hypothetical protein